MLVMGSMMVGAGAVIVGLLALLFRHPRAPRWTEPEVVAMVALIPVTGLFGLGLGYMLAGGYRLLQGTGEVYELGAPLATAIVLAALWRLTGIRGRLAGYEAATAAASVDPVPPPTSVPEGPPSPPATRRSWRRPARKAA